MAVTSSMLDICSALSRQSWKPLVIVASEYCSATIAGRLIALRLPPPVEPDKLPSNAYWIPPRANTQRDHPINHAPTSYSPSITRVSPRRLTLPYDLDNLAPSETKIPRNGIADLNSGQLALLQPISLQQGLFLLGAQQDMFGHQFVMGDVDEQILLEERLDDGR